MDLSTPDFDDLSRVYADGAGLRHCSLKSKNNKFTVLVAVKHDGMNLAYASPHGCDDLDIVMVAVSQNGLCLRFASYGLRNNKDVVLAAVAQNGMSIRFANFRLTSDPDIAVAAVRNNPRAVVYVPLHARAVFDDELRYFCQPLMDRYVYPNSHYLMGTTPPAHPSKQRLTSFRSKLSSLIYKK